MLPFELSAIDLILAIAVIVLLLLYITRSMAKPSTRERPLVKKESSAEKPATEAVVPAEEREKTASTRIQPQTGSGKCPFEFGYLRKLGKEASIPDGCLSCSRMLECYVANE